MQAPMKIYATRAQGAGEAITFSFKKQIVSTNEKISKI
jgi:hypothetical protein